VDVLIYVADGMINDDLDYAARLEARFTTAGLTCESRDLTALPTEEPPSARAYVFTGGQTSVLSGTPWMRAATRTARQLMANADRADYAVIGICLGAQIMAEALRPDSIVSAATIEVGLVPVTRPTDQQIQEIVPSFHYQAISPHINAIAGAHIEWCNAHTAVQAFRYGERTVGYQFHPELLATDVHNLIDYHADVVTRWHGDVAAAHQSVDRNTSALSPDLFRRLVIDRILG
jgi:GMP synthase-like glutamine amidotransferase